MGEEKAEMSGNGNGEIYLEPNGIEGRQTQVTDRSASPLSRKNSNRDLTIG